LDKKGLEPSNYGKGEVDMKLVRRLQNRFGSRWVKVKFYETNPLGSNSNSFEGDRFCEAVTESYRTSLVLTRQNTKCPGAQYVFGWNGDIKPLMVQNFCKELGFPLERAETIINRLPMLKQAYAAIGLNQKGESDVLVSYLQPEQLMEIVKVYQRKTGLDLAVRLSSVTSVCGDTAVSTFLNQRISFSFGCPKARKYGRIGRDRLSVGIPSGLARLLLEL